MHKELNKIAFYENYMVSSTENIDNQIPLRMSNQVWCEKSISKGDYPWRTDVGNLLIRKTTVAKASSQNFKGKED